MQQPSLVGPSIYTKHTAHQHRALRRNSWRGTAWDSLDDLQHVLLLIDKLLVVLVVVEVSEELHQALAVAPQDVLDDGRLLRVGDEDLA